MTIRPSLSSRLLPTLSTLLLAACGAEGGTAHQIAPISRRSGGYTLNDADLVVHLSPGWTVLSAAGLGDLTGDGNPDLAVAVATGTDSSTVFVLAGPLTGSVKLPADAWTSVEDEGSATLGLGSLVALPGEAGNSRLAIGAAGDAHDDGRVYIFDGPLPPASLSVTDASVKLRGGADERAGTAMVAADLTGDGVVDLAIGAPESGSATGYGTWSPGRVYVVPGSVPSGSLASLAVAVIEGDDAYSSPIMANVGASLALLDDQTGNGLPELAFGAPETWMDNQEGSVGVAASPIEGTLGWGDLLVRYGGNSLYHLGTGLTSVDTNGDGRRDLVAHSHDGLDNEVCIWTETVLDGTAADCSTVISQTLLYYGSSTIEIGLAGDQDGDGQDDIVMHITGLDEDIVGLLYGPLADGAIVIEAWSDFDAWFSGAVGGMSVGDADGDGSTDMALVGEDTAGEAGLYVFFARPPEGSTESTSSPLSMAELRAGDLVVSEIMANPSGCSDATAEWIEVHNTTDQAIDLEGLVLVDTASTEGSIEDPTIIDAGGFAVLGIGSADLWCDNDVSVDAFYGNTPKWNNSGPETVNLTWQGQVLDQAAAYDRAASGGDSLALPDDALDAISNDDPSRWCTAEPTPGRANHCR